MGDLAVDVRQAQADMRSHLIHRPARDIIPPLDGRLGQALSGYPPLQRLEKRSSKGNVCRGTISWWELRGGLDFSDVCVRSKAFRPCLL
jgi:hypothetical protein